MSSRTLKKDDGGQGATYCITRRPSEAGLKKGKRRMKGVSALFFITGVISVVAGMAWGIQMSASGEHKLASAHSHLGLLGWVSFSIFAFYYHLVPTAGAGILAKLHFALALAGLGTMVPGIVMAITERGHALAQIGSVLTLASMVLFLVIVLRESLALRAA